MVYVNIHFESFDDKSFDLIRKFANAGPIAVSISPFQIPLMQSDQITELKEMFKKPGYVLGQQGLNHKCEKCIDLHCDENMENGIDPWHENYCLWNGPIPAERQEEFMREGRDELVNVFSKKPEMYVPPNSLFDANTMLVAKTLGFSMFASGAICENFKPHIYNGILVVPEGKDYERVVQPIYMHSDWDGDAERILEFGLESHLDIKTFSIDKDLIEKNRELKLKYKIRRDLVERLKVKCKNIDILVDICYGNLRGSPL